MKSGKKRLRPGLLVLLLAAALAWLPGSAAEVQAADADVWDGGTGDWDSPEDWEQDDDGYYLIDSAEKLAFLAEYVNDVDNGGCDGFYFRLTTDIDLDDNPWTPIGKRNEDEESPFYGVFDGQGHTISGLYIEDSENSATGLFGYLYPADATEPQISNLVVKGESYCNYTSDTVYAGGIAGYAEDDIYLENLRSEVSIEGEPGNEGYIGGIIGGADGDVKLEKCSNYGSLNLSAGVYVGGIIGGAGAHKITVFDSYNRGAVEVAIRSGAAGGIVGYADGILNLKNCYNDSQITIGRKGTQIGAILGYQNTVYQRSSTYKNLHIYTANGGYEAANNDDTLNAAVNATAQTDAKAMCDALGDSFAMGTVPGQTEECPILKWEKQAASSARDKVTDLLAEYQAAENQKALGLTDEEWQTFCASLTTLDGSLPADMTEDEAAAAMKQVKKVLTDLYYNDSQNGKLDQLLASVKQEDYTEANWAAITKAVSDAKASMEKATPEEALTVCPQAYKTAADTLKKTATIAADKAREEALQEITKAIEDAKSAITGIEENDFCRTYELVQQAVTTYKAEAQDKLDAEVTQDKLKTLKDLGREADITAEKEKILGKIAAVRETYDQAVRTALTVHEIGSAEEWNAAAAEINTMFRDSASRAKQVYNIRLTGDVTLGDNWTQMTYYRGIFLGDGHSVKGITSIGKGGLIASLLDARIQDVTLQGAAGTKLGNTNTLEKSTGVLANVMEAASTVEIQNCVNNVDIQMNASGKIGGLIGQIKNDRNMNTTLTLRSCVNNGKLVNTYGSNTTITSDYLGGLIGYCLLNTKVTLDSCVNNGELETGSVKAGGLVGGAYTVEAKNCKNTGNISATYVSKVQTQEANWALGGLFGSLAGADSTVEACSNTGSITGNYGAGGLVGVLDATTDTTISDCWNAGAVKNQDEGKGKTLGGLIGRVANTKNTLVTDVYNCGEVSGEEQLLGGITGNINLTSRNGKFTLKNAYSTVVPKGGKKFGSVIGGSTCWADNGNNNVLIFENCYGPAPAYGDETGTVPEGILTSDGKTAEELQKALGDSFQLTEEGAVDLKSHASYVEGDVDSQKELAREALSIYEETDYYPTQWKLLADKKAAYLTQIDQAEDVQSIRNIRKSAVDELGQIPGIKTIDTSLTAAKKSYLQELNSFADTKGFQKELQEKIADSKKRSEALDTAKSSIAAVTGEAYAVNYGMDRQNETLEKILSDAKAVIREIILSYGGWDGETVSEPKASDGIYQISNGAELAWLAKQKDGKNAVLTADIDLGGRSWTPINLYNGKSFDGQDHTVYGLYVDGSSLVKGGTGKQTVKMGLFGEVQESVVENLTVYGELWCDKETADQNVGGIAGYIQNRSSVKNCKSYVTIDGRAKGYLRENCLGGIVGSSNNSVISGCENYGFVKGSGGYYVGGIVGYAGSDVIVTYCVNQAAVGELEQTMYAGGIAGWAGLGATVRQSYSKPGAANPISASRAGGIVGLIANTGVDNNAGNVSVLDCYNMGPVKAKRYAGGIAGEMNDQLYITQAPKSAHVIQNTYNAGGVTCESLAGGIIGNFQCGTLENNYVNSGSATVVYGQNGNIYTKMQGSNAIKNDLPTMGHQYLGSSFCKDLDASGQKNGGYPILTWQSASAELRTKIFDASGELQAEWLTLDNEFYKYGSQYAEIQRLVEDYCAKLAQAQSEDEIQQILGEAEEALKAVKTELDLTKETALAAIQKSYDARNGKCTEEDQQKLNILLPTAKSEIEAVEIDRDNQELNSSEKAVGKVNDLQNQYQKQIEAIQTIEDTQLADVKDAAVSQLGAAYEKLIAENKYTEENQKKLSDAKTAAEKAIREAADHDAVTKALNQGVRDMEKIPADTTDLDAEALYQKLRKDLENEIQDRKDSGAYAEAQQEELTALNTEYQEKFAQAKADRDELQRLYQEAIAKADQVQTKEALDSEALKEAKDQAKAALTQKHTELLEAKKDVLSEADQSRMEKLLQDALASVEQATSTDEVTKTQKETEDAWDALIKAAEDPDIWHGGETEEAPQIGKDTAGRDWYLISTPSELAWLAKQVNTGKLTTANAKLQKDLNLGSQPWTPVGTKENPWQGIFDGDGHTIQGLYIAAKADSTGVGLIGYARSSTIQNLKVSGQITAPKTERVGGFLGSGESVSLNNCVSAVDIAVSSDTTTPTGVGGAVGYLTGAQTSVTGVSYEGTIQVTPAAADNKVPQGVGGIAGYLEYDSKVRIEQCVNDGQVLTENGKNVGGIVGQLENKSNGSMTLSYCANHGAVTGVESLGGILGFAKNDSRGSLEISWVYNTGNVQGNEGKTSENLGGIAGRTTGSAIVMARSYNKVLVNADRSGTNVGALVGYAENGGFETGLYALDGTASNTFGLAPAAGTSASFVSAEQAVSGELAKALNAGTIYTNFRSLTGKNDSCPVLWFEITFADEKNAAEEELKQSFAESYQEDNYEAEQWNELQNLLNEKLNAIRQAADEAALSEASKPDMSDMAQVKTKEQVRSEAVLACKEELTAKYNEYCQKMDDYKPSDWATLTNAYNNGIAAIEAAADKAVAEEAKNTALTAMGEVKTRAEQETETGDEAVKRVMDLIDGIGEVSLDSLTDIQTAENAYAALTEEQKAKVTNYETLTAARARYEELAGETGGDDADQKKAELVDYLIENLGEISKSSKAAIENARSAYNNLTDAQKKLVTKLSKLEEAENAYDNLCIQEFYDAYAAIGSKVTEKSGAAIENARTVYEGLSAAQKEKVDQKYVQSLEQAEADYKDIQGAVAVASKINAIGTVSVDSRSKKAIEEAKSAYDGLNQSQKSYLADLGYTKLLEEAITTYNDLAAAENVKALITGIGTVTKNSGNVIKEARKAYDALTDMQKSYVSKAYYSILTQAESKYEALTSGSAANVTGSLITPGLIKGGLQNSLTSTDVKNSSLLDGLTTTGGSLSELQSSDGETATGSDTLLDKGDLIGNTGEDAEASETDIGGNGSNNGQNSAQTVSATAGTNENGNYWKIIAIALAIVLALVLMCIIAVIFYTAGTRRKERFSDMQ